MNDPSEYNIRPAARQDTPLIFNFIRKLAEYENKLNLVSATERDIEKYLFDLKIAEGIIGEFDGRPAGFAIFFNSFSTFMGKPGIYVEDLYVDMDMRNMGLGIRLFAYIARLALEQGCGFLEWSVLKWNKPSIAFYENIGAEKKDEWDHYSLSGEPFKKLAKYE